MCLTIQLTKYLALTVMLSLGNPVPDQDPVDPPRPPALEEPAELKKGEASDKASAESVAKEAYNLIAGDSQSKSEEDTLSSKKLLAENTPDWVKHGIVSGDDHSFAISSSLLPDLDQCREDLENRLMGEVEAYLEQHVLTGGNASQLTELTKEYVKKHWINAGQEFDNVQERPSGTYHQLWIGLHLSSDQFEKVRNWEKKHLRDKRVKQVGIAGGFGVAVITLLSGVVGVFARREKAKLKA